MMNFQEQRDFFLENGFRNFNNTLWCKYRGEQKNVQSL